MLIKVALLVAFFGSMLGHFPFLKLAVCLSDLDQRGKCTALVPSLISPMPLQLFFPQKFSQAILYSVPGSHEE